MSQLSRATRPLRAGTGKTLSRRCCHKYYYYHSITTVPSRNTRTVICIRPTIATTIPKHSIQLAMPYGINSCLSKSTTSTLRHSSSNSNSNSNSSGSSRSSGASTDASVNQRHYPDDEHVLDKGDALDVQSENSVKGRESRAQNKGGHATTEKDTRSSAERAKKEYPEAPDTVIGMQDERGGKGY